MNSNSNWDKIIDKKFLKPNEMANLLNISRPSVYRLIEKRQIPFYKIGGNLRFKKEDIINYLEMSHFEAMKY
jgi:excisionase family DNA binding protein